MANKQTKAPAPDAIPGHLEFEDKNGNPVSLLANSVIAVEGLGQDGQDNDLGALIVVPGHSVKVVESYADVVAALGGASKKPAS